MKTTRARRFARGEYDLCIRLFRTCAARVQVVDARGAPSPGCRLRFLDEAGESMVFTDVAGRPRTAVTTDRAGVAQLADLPQGYAFAVVQPAGAPAPVRRRVWLADPSSTVTIALDAEPADVRRPTGGGLSPRPRR